jgi:hypothetical protein
LASVQRLPVRALGSADGDWVVRATGVMDRAVAYIREVGDIVLAEGEVRDHDNS